MPITILGTGRRYIGISTDEKPVLRVPAGATFYETDTGQTWLFDSEWNRWLPETSTEDNQGALHLELMHEQVLLMRQILTGLSMLSGVDLSEINTTE